MLPRRQRLALELYSVSVLSGLALNLILQGRNAVMPRGVLDILKRSLIRELQQA